SADTTNGPAPLDVQFSSEGSYDLDLDALFYEWDFGDGSPPSSEPNPAHTYATAGVYTATLTVEDGLGGQGTDSIVITAGNSAPDVTIDQPAAGDTYRTGDTITYEGSAVDPEDGPLPASGLEWEIILHHGKHTHPFLNGVGDAAFQAPDHGDDTWFELTVTAADSDGLAATEQLEIFPEEVQLRFETAPAGLYIVYDGRLFETPVTIITGADSVRDIRAPSPQLHSLVAATFNSWSDGGENEHAIDTGTTDRTITAFYDLGDPDDDSDGDGCADARELGSNVSLGGERDPFNEWDVYDTSGDQVVDFFTDFFAVVSLFGIEAADPGYVEQSDRSPPPSAALEPDARKRQPWDMGPPNGVIDLFGDIFGVVNQFGHSCQ
ncbi:MAG: PKD domain-containing protein, partial [Dehalococcoidia bacterium]|nr:PKD domain-containing protein [Dehalococcoidia bacterium]